MDDNKLISPELEGSGEERLENTLRPQTLNEYIGQTKVKENMKIYIEAAKKRGHEIHMETQGVIGIEDELDPKDIAEADVVILAVDVNVKGKERFAGKKMIEVPTETVVMSPNKLIEKIEQLV